MSIKNKINVLSISGILPIPGYFKINDFLIPLYKEYLKITPASKVIFLLPRTFYPFNKTRMKILRFKKIDLEGFPVYIFPFLSFQKLKNLHALLCFTLFLFSKKSILKLIQKEQIDIIHAEYIFPDGLLAYQLKKKLDIPYLITTHKENHYFKSIISRIFAVKILKHAEKVTPLNYYQKELYEKYGVKSPKILAHGIDTRFLECQPDTDDSKKIQILTIAALLKYKNIDKVLYALSVLKDKYDFKYNIIGNGPEEDNLKQIVKRCGLENHVEFISNIPYEQIAETIGKHHIFVLPSYFETFGRVFFEAMAVGLPVICAKNTGVHGYFKEEIEGFSVHHDNSDELVEVLNKLMSNPETRMKVGNNAKKLMRKFTWDNIVREIYDLYFKSVYSK